MQVAQQLRVGREAPGKKKRLHLPRFRYDTLAVKGLSAQEQRAPYPPGGERFPVLTCTILDHVRHTLITVESLLDLLLLIAGCLWLS